MAYNEESRSKVYYCKPGSSPNEENRIVPAPQISINPEIYYANDTVIGYTQNVTLSGYAVAFRRDQAGGGDIEPGIEKTVDHMWVLRDLFNYNGGILYIKDTGGTLVLKAKGATIKSIKFDESDNKWTNFSPYTIELEFNEVDFLGCDNNTATACNSSFFHDQNKNTTSDNLVDMKKYKLKAFNDKWTFDLGNELYNQFSFGVSYTISATGKNYYNSDGELIPAWLQAKLFVQDRLYTQISAMIKNAIALSGQDNDGCAAIHTASDLYDTNQTHSLFDSSFSTANYKIYNEYINCSSSESGGTFSVTYNAIIAAQDDGAGDENNAATHTHTQNITTNNDGTDYSTSLSIQGSVQGLIEGGFIYSTTGNDFELPATGPFINYYENNQTKYSNALSSYNHYIGDNRDLKEAFKSSLDITHERLLLPASVNMTLRPSSFVLDHNYHDGSVTYSAQYDSKLNRTLDTGYANISIVHNDPVPIINEFIIPGRSGGPLIQFLGAMTAKTISINIDGADISNKRCDISDLCSSFPYVHDLYNTIMNQQGTNWIITSQQFNKNQIDGSFSMSVDFTCTQDI